MADLLLENVKINNNANKEEISAYLLLNKCLFNGHKVVIGDNVSFGQPDIFTADGEIGVEVVTCEPMDIYRNTNYRRGDIQTDINSSPNATRFQRQVYESMVNDLKYYTSRKNKNNSLNCGEAVEFYDNLESVLTSKLSKLNSGNYDACKQRDLIILSDFSYKNYVDLKTVLTIYRRTKKNFEQKFDNVFFKCSEGLYNLETRKKINFLKTNNKIKQKPEITNQQ